MTIEEKAKAYDEAINRMKHYVVDEYGCSRIKVDDVFPELAKSEGERIRKALIEGFKVMKDGSYGECTFSNYNIPVTDIIAWLEKQGEQKSANKVKDEPTWSEEDEVMFRKAIITIDNVRINTGLSEYYQGISKWLEFLKDRYTWKPSDEQITWLYRAADDASKDSRMKQVLNNLLSDLKNLKGQ